MDILLFIAIVLETIGLGILAYFFIRRDTTENERINRILTSHTDLLGITTKTFMQEITKVQNEHYKQFQKTHAEYQKQLQKQYATSEKQLAKQLTIIEKQTKSFMDGLSNVIEAMQPKPQPIIGPDLLDKEKIENTIEKEEIEEVGLDETNRIPLVPGLNVKFEGDEQIYPIQIEESNMLQ